jgi:hypothetical protein
MLVVDVMQETIQLVFTPSRRAEPWPEDWNYEDDVYIDFIDEEYYLCHPRHSGARILVIVVG